MSDRDCALHVAVLEDDDAFRDDILVPQLGESGFDTEGFGTSADLHRRLRETSFDLLVLDLGLPDAHGLDLARKLRAVSPIGIITLTGRGTRADHVRGLSEMIDAWLTKPVEVDVLAATLRSVARRMRLAGEGVAARSPMLGWRLAERDWHLYGPRGDYVSLSLLERCFVARLLATPGEVVSREELLELFTESAENFDAHRLEMLIHRLRRKVFDRLAETLPLRAVRGRGYVMVASGESAPK